MITLDANLSFYSNLYYYNLPILKYKNPKAYAAIDKYTENYINQSLENTNSAKKTEEAQENQQAEPTKNVPTDYNTLIETLKLELPASKLAILKMIPHSELMQFLFLLGKDQLLNGLKFFTKDKLLKFVHDLPKEDILKLLFKLYISKDHIVDMFPIKELNNFLSSAKIDKNNVMKLFQSMSKMELAQIAEAATGTSQSTKTHAQLLEMINTMQPEQIMEGVKGLEYKKMKNIVSDMLKQDPELYNEFSKASLYKQTEEFSKGSLIEGLCVLDETQLIQMLDKLPDVFLALVVTQIDTELFAQILVNDYQKLLGMIAA